MHFVYILYSPSADKYYVGQTENLELRLQFHNELSEHSYTSNYRPWDLKLSIPVLNRSMAMRIEKHIKKRKSRVYIEKLIGDNETVSKLILQFSSAG